MEGKDPQGEDSETLDLGHKNVAGDDEAKSSQEHPPQRPSSPPVIFFPLFFAILNKFLAIY